MDRRQRSLQRLAWTLSALGVLFGVLGEPLGFYARYAWYDELIHGFTSFWVTLLVAVYARRSIFQGLSGHVLWKLGLIAAAGVSVGVAWEIGEWLFDHTLGGPTVKSKYDTSIDLVVDTIGAVVGAGTGLWLTRSARSRSPSPLSGPAPGRMQPSAR